MSSTIHIITYTSYIPKAKYLKETELLFNCKVNYIEGPWDGWYSKIEGTQKFINSCKENDIIVFLDAHDVMISNDLNELYDKFKSYNCDLLLGAELNCYPSFLKKYMDNIMPSDLKNKYVNSGGYIGYVKTIKQMLTWKDKNELIKICKSGGDQTYVMKFFIENYKNVNIKLDTKSLIFQNMHLILWNEIKFINGKLYNTVMKTNPCFIHFNGGSWRTKTDNNIMPVISELLIKSIGNKSIPYTLNDYEQLEINNKPKAISQI